MEAKELLVFNPLLYSDMEKYIWINDISEEHGDAQHLFDRMLKEGIYIMPAGADIHLYAGSATLSCHPAWQLKGV